MSAASFAQALIWTLGYERGWSDNPRDPGGATLDGITQVVYDAWRHSQGLPARSVREMAPAERDTIYRRRYWDAVAGDDLPAGVDYAVFDFAVNSGVGRALRELQRIVFAAPDGTWGSQTQACVRGFVAQHDAATLSDAICAARLRFLQRLPTFTTFGRGWTRRVMGEQPGAQPGDTGVADRALDLARGAAPTPPGLQITTPKTYFARAP